MVDCSERRPVACLVLRVVHLHAFDRSRDSHNSKLCWDLLSSCAGEQVAIAPLVSISTSDTFTGWSGLAQRKCRLPFSALFLSPTTAQASQALQKDR